MILRLVAVKAVSKGKANKRIRIALDEAPAE